MNKLKKYIKPKKSVPKKQLGGLLSAIGGGITNSLYGQGLPNDNYNYANTGHRSTSYDGLQYIPQADEPNLMPQMLDAYNTKFKLKNLYDPTKHKFDMGDLEKDLRLRGFDKERLRMRIADAQNKMMQYGEAYKHDPEKMAQWDMQVAKLKNEMMGGMQEAFNLRKDDDVVEQQWVTDKKTGQIYASNDGQLMFKKIDKKTGRFEPVVESEVDYNDEEHSYVPIRASEVKAMKENMNWDKFGRNLNSDLITGEEATKMAEERYKDIGYALTKKPNYINQAQQSPAKQFGDHILVTTTWGQQTTEEKSNVAQLAKTTEELLNQLPKDIEKGWKRDFTDFLYRGDNLMEKKITGEKEIKDANGKVVGKQPTFEYTGKKLNKEQIAGAFSNYIAKKLEAINDKKQVSETKIETTQGVDNNVINNASDLFLAKRDAKEEADRKASINNIQQAIQGLTTQIDLDNWFKSNFGVDTPAWVKQVGSKGYQITPTPEQLKDSGKSMAHQPLSQIFDLTAGYINADGRHVDHLTDKEGKKVPLSNLKNSASVDLNSINVMYLPIDPLTKGVATDVMKKYGKEIESIKTAKTSNEEKKQAMQKLLGNKFELKLMGSARTIVNNGGGMKGATMLQDDEKQLYGKNLGGTSLYSVPMYFNLQGDVNMGNNLSDGKDRAFASMFLGFGTKAQGGKIMEQGGKLMQEGGTLDDLIENRPKLNITTLTLEDLY